MQLEIVVCTLNAISLYWFLVQFLDLGYRYKVWQDIEMTEIVKPFDCSFCMAFWCGIISTLMCLFFPIISNHLLLLTLPISIAFIINKI